MPAGVSLYHDARILLVPHRLDNRPRVITEAQANGIPVIASFTPGLAEAVGEGGILLDMDDLDGWVAAIRDMWPDAPPYDEFAKSARAYGRRPEIDPARLAQRFDLLLKETYRENSGEQVPMDEEWGEK
jgi:glycosyltransferase involved in cell wall biosynthesis